MQTASADAGSAFGYRIDLVHRASIQCLVAIGWKRVCTLHTALVTNNRVQPLWYAEIDIVG